ncbi:MAG: sigma 54-interacting transcriptional regulator [Myxococcales bacterium]|nr:sigma 54-interacting transcriptional regulator [Myxococcales bacterium]
MLGLCAFYRGQLDEAERHFAAAERAAVADAQPVALGRALSLRGMVAQQRGQLALASDRYAHAAHLLSAAGEAHAAATADLNLGTALAERGRHGAALSHTMAAGRVFRSLGADADWVAAEVNRGNSLVALGETTIARQVIEAAQRDPAASPHLRAFARLILAEAARRDGDLGSARAWCAEVAEDAQQRGDAHALISAQVGLAEAGAGLPHDDLAALATSEDDRQRAALACARRTLLLGGSAAQLGAASASAEAVARRAQDDDRQERAFRGYAVAAALAQRAQDPAAAPLAQRALAAYGALVTAAPATSAPALERDPDRRALSELTAPAPSPAPAPPQPVGPAPHVARRLLALSLRISREIELPRVLDEVIDTAIELAHAERGFLLLRQADSLLAPVVARNFPASSSGGAADQISRSIAERAAQSGEPVLTIDAGQDARFDSASSVAALRLRSVLAVPLRVRGAAIGCIYVDHRLRRGAFDDDAAAVLTELADIAAIAIANAQLTAELRQRNAEIDRLNHALAAELAERDAELVRVRAAEGHGSAPPVRNRYDAIAGTSPPMLQMLALLDRAATTSFPVVVTGESGTGKELVARALHDHSTRRAGPFVAVNCGALPDTLLESELFGHVRGAFTGADRDRRGMFEVAHGGTLFLDEISDTSPAMQARLLRVLQDGVVRRLGDTATTKVDVRVVAASHTPLAQLVTAGRFREDLRFRLEVLSIAVPPLRDRLGDLPALVEHLLRQLGATLSPARPTPRLARAALRALGQHRWPGNVRELANVLAHGLAMAGDAEVIELEDLPAALAAPHKLPADVTGARRAAPGAAPVVELPPDGDLRLRPALRATERAYLRAAMERTGGNQTAAARLLGLSRFGLQKKLRRGEQDSDSDDDDAT